MTEVTTFKKAQIIVLLIICLNIFNASKGIAAITLDSKKKDAGMAANQRFYKGDRIRQYIGFSGHRDSDYNSEEYELNVKYLYKSKRVATIIDFMSEDIRERSRSGKGGFIKRIEDRDLSLEGKFKILDQQNYVILYHRSIHTKTETDEVKYYNYRQSAAGVGRAFFGGNLELDVSFGYRHLDDDGYSTNLIPSYRFEHRFDENIRFTQRGFAFLDRDDSVEYELRSYLTYKMSEKLSFRITHLYQKRYSIDDGEEDNRVARRILLGLVYNI